MMPILSKYLRLLLLGCSLLLISACDGAPKSLSELKKMTAQNTEFNYQIYVGNPDGYEVTYEYQHSYFMDHKGEVITRFGGLLGGGDGWGSGSQNSPRDDFVLPAAFKIRWFSETENQFWEGEFKLDQQALYELVKNGYQTFLEQTNEHTTYSQFTVNVAPGGLVVLWLGGGAQAVEIGAFQAHKIEMDWQEFCQYSIEYEIGRQAFIDLTFSDSSETTKKILQQIKTGTLPTDSNPWKLWRRKYHWRLQLNSPFELGDFRAWYVNGERYYDAYVKKVGGYQESAVPNRIFFSFKLPNQEVEYVNLELDQDAAVEAYKKLDGNKMNQLDLLVKISEDLSNIDVFLKNKDEETEIKIVRAYRQDL